MSSTETEVPEVHRIHGKRGRKKVSHAPQLLLHNFRGQVRTAAPSSFDALPGLKSCGMLGNDQDGDCGPAAVEHGRIVKIAKSVTSNGAAVTPSTFVAPTTPHTLGWYYAYGTWMGEPGKQPDEGVDNLTMLSYLFKITGGVLPTPAGDDIQAWAFAEIDSSNINEIKQAICDFNGLLMGCALTDEAEQEFDDNDPWTITASEQPDPNEGHDIYVLSYDSAHFEALTWGARQKMTLAWEQGEQGAHDLELWAFVTEEDVKSGKLTNDQFQALLTECQTLAGSVNPDTPTPAPPVPPAPVPTPAPVPVPTPTPAPVPVPTPTPTPDAAPPIPTAETLAWMQSTVDYYKS